MLGWLDFKSCDDAPGAGLSTAIVAWYEYLPEMSLTAWGDRFAVHGTVVTQVVRDNGSTPGSCNRHYLRI